jgi:alpha-1,3-rhamnosyl/mannosyltransferase
MAELVRRNRGKAPADLVLAGYSGWGASTAGSGSDRATLGPSLFELGRLDDQHLWALYRGATVFAFPSLHEGFGLPIIEALNQGTALICSDLPVMHEIAASAALYVPASDVQAWADAIDALLTDQRARRELAERGHSRTKKFTVARQLEGTYSVYVEAGGSAYDADKS